MRAFSPDDVNATEIDIEEPPVESDGREPVSPARRGPDWTAVRTWLRRRWVPLAMVAAVLAAVLTPIGIAYGKYSRIVDRTLRQGPFAHASNIYSGPRTVLVGESIGARSVAAYLRRAGYSPSQKDPVGFYRMVSNGIEIHPGPQSYFQEQPAIIRFHNGAIANIQAATGASVVQYRLEPELITNLVDGDREKRDLVRFSQIPPVLVRAVTSAEDKRFFEHMGFDPLRLMKAAYVDLKYGRKEQGASTITMQLARSLWLEPQKLWRRKFSELIIALILEHKLSKQEIFQFYANQVYLGRSDTYSIHGFGEASQVYFNTDISQLTLPEAAMLAGLVQRPSYFNPFEHPNRALARRNIVLSMMRDDRVITTAEYNAALAAPLGLAPRRKEPSDAPYFLALVNDELQNRIPDSESDTGSYQVYTTLDPDLQRAAEDAVKAGMAKVDAIVMRKRGAKSHDRALPQVSLIALDPHTGQVKALVGGTDFRRNQFNHAIAMRQPGSSFKPFVYAAALDTGLNPGGQVLTPISTVIDQPTTFTYGEGQTYAPSNFGGEFYGTVSLKAAMAHSLNVATVMVAQEVGYPRIVALARAAGLTGLDATPAIALGSYDETPLAMAGAYTVFANKGVYVKPTFLDQVRDRDGRVVAAGSDDTHRVLDPRVAFLMVDMLQEVMRSGTGAGVWSQGFKGIAAGKTGTSHDGWFAGFTPNLLCVVWVGFDDDRDLNIEGAKSALPIWADFMQRAAAIDPSSKSFGAPPPGVVGVNIDPETGELAGPYCPRVVYQYFIDGTQPNQLCEVHGDRIADPLALNEISASPVLPRK
jgi:penicillin-binding protein 1B